MSGNLKDILSHLSTEFTDDAMDGLQEIKNKQKISSLVEQLNRDLHKKLEKKKKRKEKLRFKDQPWLYIAIVIILLLIVLSYIVIHRMLQQQ